MIDWIKFKGSTEEERWDEIKLPAMAGNNKDAYTFQLYEKDKYPLSSYTHWAPLNLPQEEKWERKYNFRMSCNNQNLLEMLCVEFDNIYSKLNELRKK